MKPWFLKVLSDHFLGTPHQVREDAFQRTKRENTLLMSKLIERNGNFRSFRLVIFAWDSQLLSFPGSGSATARSPERSIGDPFQAATEENQCQTSKRACQLMILNTQWMVAKSCASLWTVYHIFYRVSTNISLNGPDKLSVFCHPHPSSACNAHPDLGLSDAECTVPGRKSKGKEYLVKCLAVPTRPSTFRL